MKLAKDQKGKKMMMDSFGGMGLMMGGMGLFVLLTLAVLVLGAAALVKYLKA